MKSAGFLLFALYFCNSDLPDKKCIKGDIEYSVATYSDEIFLKTKYQKLLDSLLQEPVFDFFCNQKIKNLPMVDKDKEKNIHPSESHVIEPLFIDLSNFDGIYGKRIYSHGRKVRSIRWRCGYYHYVFLISDHKYYDFSSDTIKNQELIEKHLRSTFTEVQISRMVDYYKYGDICDHYTFLPTTFIKKGDQVIFDAIKE